VQQSPACMQGQGGMQEPSRQHYGSELLLAGQPASQDSYSCIFPARRDANLCKQIQSRYQRPMTQQGLVAPIVVGS
jgi:hypothetical protein